MERGRGSIEGQSVTHRQTSSRSYNNLQVDCQKWNLDSKPISNHLKQASVTHRQTSNLCITQPQSQSVTHHQTSRLYHNLHE